MHIHDHVRRLGEFPHGTIDEHRTGYWMLDLNVPRSSIGTKLRKLGAFYRGEPEDAVHDKAHRAPRRTEAVATESFVSAVVNAEEPLSALKAHLEHSNRHASSHMRKLSDAWLGAAATLPLTATRLVTRYGEYPVSGDLNCGKKIKSWKCKPKGADALKEAARILVFDTCKSHQCPACTTLSHLLVFFAQCSAISTRNQRNQTSRSAMARQSKRIAVDARAFR